MKYSLQSLLGSTGPTASLSPFNLFLRRGKPDITSTGYGRGSRSCERIPAEFFSCYQEARSGRSVAQFDASSYSSSTLSSGVSSWKGGTSRSRSSHSSAESPSRRKPSPHREKSRTSKRPSVGPSSANGAFQIDSGTYAIRKKHRDRSAPSAVSPRNIASEERQSRARTKGTVVPYSISKAKNTARAHSLGRPTQNGNGKSSDGPRPPIRSRRRAPSCSTVSINATGFS